ncbi:protein PRRC2C-like [Macrobrachium rosenbergii]|uniref:protein PRRC2C-like n=1 Tax=Macrobrachium rosenbergii TaxID=79674 RepID=UPI0034D6EC8B
MSDSNSLPVPLESPEQCQAPSLSDVAPLLTLTSVPGPELVPVPDPHRVTDPPTGDPPNLTELIITNYEPPTPDVSSSQSPSSAKDEPLTDLNVKPSLVDQELSGWDADAGSTLVTVVTAPEVGSLPVAPKATSDPAPDSTSGLSPDLVPSSPPRNGIARPWRNPKKKKKGQKRST